MTSAIAGLSISTPPLSRRRNSLTGRDDPIHPRRQKRPVQSDAVSGCYPAGTGPDLALELKGAGAEKNPTKPGYVPKCLRINVDGKNLT